MPQQANHYSLRLTGTNDADRITLMQRTGASANAVLNAALSVGFAALIPKWKAPNVHATTKHAIKGLIYNGNARKFRTTLLTARATKAPHAK